MPHPSSEGSGRRPRPVLGVALCSLLCLPTTALAQPPTVGIRVVDLADLGRTSLGQSLNVTQSLYRSVGIAVTWRRCSDTTDDCSSPLEANEVWLRIVPGRATRDGWAGDWVSAQALGFSNLDASPNKNVMSTVFVGQVAHLAGAARMPIQSLLGQVAAHEIAHLLLGSMRHTNTGLMSARWPIRVFHGPRHFSDEVGTQLRAALVRRSLP